MSGHTYERKRSLQDSIIDLRLSMALNHLEAFKEELEGIEETEEMEEKLWTILEHITVLEDILKSAKKPKVTIPTAVSLENLKKAGIERKHLIFVPTKITDLTKGLTSDANIQIMDLHTRIKEIYACVNMDYEPGSRMILDAILLTLRKITLTQQSDVAILPEMRIAQGDGIQISHPISGYELWLSGNVDYVVIEYENVMDNKARLLSPSGSREDAFEIANSYPFLLVEAKYQNIQPKWLSSIPEAVSQAIALLKSACLPEVRFCLSDGQTWIFFILKLENNTLTYYESEPFDLTRWEIENTDLPLRKIMLLVCEWLRPTVTDLFELD